MIVRTGFLGVASISLVVLSTAALLGPAEAGRKSKAPREPRVIRVPEDVRTPRAAMRKARPGDTVDIAPGRYSGRLVVKRPGVTVIGSGAEFHAKKRGRKVIVIRGDGSSVSGIVVVGGRVDVRADDVRLQGLQLREAGRGVAIDVRGDGAHIDATRVDAASFSRPGEAVIRVQGDDAVVEDTRSAAIVFQGARWGQVGQVDFVHVVGDRARVWGTRLGVGIGAVGVRVVGRDARVSRNRLEFAPEGIVVVGDGAKITDNAVLDGIGIAIDVVGDDTLLTDNTCEGRAGDGLRVRGADFDVSDNAISMGALTRDVPRRVESVSIPVQQATAGYDPVIGGAPQEDVQIVTTPACPGIVVRGDQGGSVVSNEVRYEIGTAVDAEIVGATITDNEMIPTTRNSGDGMVVRGTGNLIADNRMKPAHFGKGFSFRIRGSSNDVRGNTVDGSRYFSILGIDVEGTRNEIRENEIAGVCWYAICARGGDNTVADNRVDDPFIGYSPQDLDERGPLIDIHDDRNHVEDNVVVLEQGKDWVNGLYEVVSVRGDENVVAANHLEGLAPADVRPRSVTVRGDDNVVMDNAIVDSGDFAVLVSGDGNEVFDNVSSNTLPIPDSPPWSTSNGAAILVIGADNHVRGNETEGAWATGVRVSGDRAVVEGNLVTDPGKHGFEVDGDDHDLVANTATGTVQTGFCIDSGTGIVIENCVATRSGACGIEAGAELVSLIGNVCTDSGVHDIQVTGTLDVFEDNVFETFRQGSVDPLVE